MHVRVIHPIVFLYSHKWEALLNIVIQSEGHTHTHIQCITVKSRLKRFSKWMGSSL